MTEPLDIDREINKADWRHRQRVAKAVSRGRHGSIIFDEPTSLAPSKLPPTPAPPFYPTEVSALCGRGWLEVESPRLGAAPWWVRAAWPPLSPPEKKKPAKAVGVAK